MNLTKKISLALVSIVAASTGFSQTTPAAATDASSGVLGQRFAQVSFGISDVHGASDNGYNADFGVNLPVTPNLDLGFNYGYSWLKSGGVKLRGHALSALATGYTNYSGVKPFVGVGVGYEWAKASFGPFSSKNDDGIWGVAAGVEIPAGDVTLTPSIAYVDGFKSGTPGAYNYGVEASTWLSQTLAGFADITYSDVRGNGGQSWNYTIGVRVRF